MRYVDIDHIRGDRDGALWLEAVGKACKGLLPLDRRITEKQAAQARDIYDNLTRPEGDETDARF
jgi:hypothetical protein